MSDEIKPCPFCGGRCVVNEPWPKGSSVWAALCLVCGYRAGDCGSKAAAIRDHNRVSAAVAKEKKP